MVRYVVQDTWNDEDDQELREYLESVAAEKNSGVVVDYLPEEKILQLQPRADTVLFVDSSLVQKLLQRVEGEGKLEVTDTYPKEFETLYKRRINKTVLKNDPNDNDDDAVEYPYFVKL